MSKGKSTWKYNKLLTARRNYFLPGGLMSLAAGMAGNIAGGLGVSMENLANEAEALGQATNSVLSLGMSSGAGKVMSGIGNIAGKFGPVGLLANAGILVLAGGVNALFGNKINQENVDAARSNITSLQSFNINAMDFDSLLQDFSSAAPMNYVTTKEIGKDGLFSNKALATAKTLNDRIYNANLFVQNSLENQQYNIEANQMRNQLSNYTAFGGWLNSKGADFFTGLTHIDKGGTHELNPNLGVLIGVDPEGVPNLVEEGETIFNDYVYSKRLKVPSKVRKKYKLGGELSFADASKKLAKEAEERPNDPISKKGIEVIMKDLANALEQLKMQQKLTLALALFASLPPEAQIGVMDMANQQAALEAAALELAAQQDPAMLLQMLAGMPAQGMIPQGYALGGNLYSGEEPYSSLMKVVPAVEVENANVSSDNTVPTANRFYWKSPDGEYVLVEGDNPYLTIKNKGDVVMTGSVKNSNEGLDYYYALKDPVQKKSTWMREVPIWATGLATVTDSLGLTNKEDYSDAVVLRNAAERANNVTPITFRPIGNYLTYNPYDLELELNQIKAATSGANRAYMNASTGSRGAALAGILANNYNAYNSIGQARRAAMEANIQNRLRIEDFNRQTNTINSQGFMDVASRNQDLKMNAYKNYLDSLGASIFLRQQEKANKAAVRMNNLNQFINSLGALGKENFIFNQIGDMPLRRQYKDNNGSIGYGG